MALDAAADGRGRGVDFPILIVGTGFAGLGMAIALKQAGIHTFTVLERASSVGGTWRDNHYPGCACDVQSHLYSFSFEQNPGWSRMFAPQPEIKAYLEGVARKYALLPHIRFDTQVTTARYDEAAGLWTVTTAEGRSYSARVLISGMGGLSMPAYPDLPGLERFKGQRFHSADWDHGYSLEGKRVAVIGTGASAIQFVPQIQKKVAQLELYQRTPPWIMPKPDRVIGVWERALYRHFPGVQRLYRGLIYGMLESRVLAFVINPGLMKFAELGARRHLKRQVSDPRLRSALTPDFTFGCKRVLISDDYYPAVSSPNVALITQGIREVREHGVVTQDGVEHPADCIIFGTGFKAQDPLPRGAIFGRGGADIFEAWRQGAEAYKGTSVAGFPNFFMIVGPNTGLGHSSMVYMIESQIAYVLDAVRQMRNQGWTAVEVRADQQAQYNDRLRRKLDRAIWSSGGCRSWYLDANGRNTTLWPGFTFKFRRQLARFDAQHYRVETRVKAAP